ncbi:bifunctional UDP-N-acetylglucosamine diphosphorylase/glucosamine-1-phosphate N-acetyltransferase GlmU [Desulfosporosinus nitroreducens]|uniref:bifunctional UDP-N-acetylglucosamine diphosphorylase/glucosamine-1-phosphate N-acetyltransferase GlmU n=1 Tax=Desulfosporosinus nitroreducens TaxID=2018668 RepID=UPI00207C31BC|nr:bifunctional UDP-N-acetylglucosamine diphosphorylase/glucosamine-1-phosphate N-acetyltransferase GlmU [Desulfosporosinus nitroreducens]MCO1604198.1 bifunctional UDP-N-acetylglucosamine diphosphorylase/glucosamine-1-phosphate N-acetyltransferase GlmU [Desulfosporosinus nitroreducens]
MSNLVAVIMAAGKGTRMKSKLPKVMHSLAGKTLIEHVLDIVGRAGVDRSLVIVGHGREGVKALIENRAEIVVQTEQLGTGHAVLQAMPYLEGEQTVLVLSGDQPLLKSETLNELVKLHQAQGASATVLTSYMEQPFGYGRIIKKGENLVRIVEEKDAAPDEREIKEINTGTYCFKGSALKDALTKITTQNAQGEYYLTEVFDVLLKHEKTVLTYRTVNSQEALGINSRGQLAEAEGIVRKNILEHWMSEGVTIVDPASTFIDAEVILAQDVTILPFTRLVGKTKIEEDSVIGPQTNLENCTVGRGSEVTCSVARDAVIGECCHIGPFSYLRPGTKLDARVKVGDFVEIKNSWVEMGAKIPHLSYIGDTHVGKSANIGAGTITCNYDGVNKHHTKIGDHAFIGSNTNLVAPLEVGEYAVTGAGSTITKNVPAKALVVERSQQVVKENWHREKIK